MGKQESTVEWLSPPWGMLILVCGECQRRKAPPLDLDAKTMRRALKEQLRDLRPKTRILESRCLGICPKHGLTVTVAGGGETRIAEVDGLDAAQRLAQTLRAETLPR